MTVCSSTQRKKRKMTHKIKKLDDHNEFLNRITKTLYYGKVPLTDRFSLPVSELAAELFSEVKRGCSLDRLHVDEAAQISRNACVSPCSLVLALLYLERLKTCNSEYMERVPPSELFLVSMMVASKFLHDDGEEDEVFNDEWATSGGIELKDMNRLEREFLNAINWEVYVSEQAFWTRLHSMEAELALREGKRRGWFSYTELACLVKAVQLASLAHTLITVSAVCLTSYTASVLAMIGSTIVVNQIPSVATHLSSSAFPSSPAQPLLPSQLPATTSDSCLMNKTLPDEASLPWQQWSGLHLWNKEDVGNHSSSEKLNALTDLSTYRENDRWQNDRVNDLENDKWQNNRVNDLENDKWQNDCVKDLRNNKWQNNCVKDLRNDKWQNDRVKDLEKYKWQNDPVKESDWLATITDLVKVASTSTTPSMILPVEILIY